MKQLRPREETVAYGRWSHYAFQMASRYYATTGLRRFYDVIRVEGHGFYLIGNGHPYVDNPTLRSAEHRLFREWCKANGITVLAEHRDRTQYTVVLILNLEPDADDERFAVAFAHYARFTGSPAAVALAASMDADDAGE